MNKREALRLARLTDALIGLGFTAEEAGKLRRISLTLHRWHELECGTGDGRFTQSIERDGDENDSRPYLRTQGATSRGYIDRRYPIPDRETGAKKRLAAILKARNERASATAGFNGRTNPAPLSAYIQTDPRGAALYILRPGDVPEGEDMSCYYSRGICVY